MYLHLGAEVTAKNSDIIGIFDLDTSTVTRPTRVFLEKMQKEDRVINVGEQLPKSFVLTGKQVIRLKEGTAQSRKARRDTCIYISPLASSTLRGRAGHLEDYE